MESLIIKGTIVGFSYDQWKNDPDTIATWLFCVMEDWISSNFEPTGQFKIDYAQEVRRKYGEVRASVVAFENDVHNLSVCIHHLHYVICDDKLERGLKILYISNIVENFITNVRSLYDHLAVFARIIVDHKYLPLGTVSQDSLNALIKKCENNRSWAVQVFTDPLVKVIESCKPSLYDVKQIRDAIIHDGKEPIVNFKSGAVVFRIPKNIRDNTTCMLPNLLRLETPDFPLLAYLQCLTKILFTHIDDMGVILMEEFYERDNAYKPELIVLGGICMPDFVKFINYNYNM